MTNPLFIFLPLQHWLCVIVPPLSCRTHVCCLEGIEFVLRICLLFYEQEDVFYSDEPDRNTYNNYRMYLSSPQGYGEEEPGPYQDEPENLTSTERYNTSQSNRLKSNTNTTNYVDFYSTSRRPSQKANQYTGSPDSWV